MINIDIFDAETHCYCYFCEQVHAKDDRHKPALKEMRLGDPMKWVKRMEAAAAKRNA
jgi:hypothetical protein